MRTYKPLLTLLFLFLSCNSFATHYYGVDLYYTHVSGNIYKVTIEAYGDCSGQAFPTFPTIRPRIHILRGTTEVIDDFLDLEPPLTGVEVTPVCPAELKNTTCANPAGTVPGVTKFVYSKAFTLSPASDWSFVYRGESDGNTIAGRSNSLSNLFSPGVITLEATLDNTQYVNSSPEYTTIATPFYCVNRPVNFNPGAVDADGDSLVYELVPGMDVSGPTKYLPGFTGSNPLDVAANSFQFSSSTGQLSFTGKNTQRSLVVYRVSEYRNGKLLGTSMREMTVVVMVCDNNPPKAFITNPSGATQVDSVTVKTCMGNHELAFDIDPGDADNGQIITITGSGLPKDAKLNITGNGTTKPRNRFVWQMPTLPLGDYTFYVTYTDDGCPIASKQTQAYTIRIANDTVDHPMTGYISNVKGATIVDSFTVRTCAGNHELAFDINPFDSDTAHSLTMEPETLPGNAKLNVNQNGTKRPLGKFAWNMPKLPYGADTFFVNYTDNGCPAASRKQPYVIRIAPDDIASDAVGAECQSPGLVTVKVPEGWAPWYYEVRKGADLIYGKSGVAGNTATNDLAKGTYVVRATNHYGCSSEIPVEVPYKCNLIDIPTAFSPNSDGNNDILFAVGENIKDIRLKVYNRWGQLVFESNDMKMGWDGKYKSAEVEMETYAYILSGMFKDGQTFYKKGNVTLIR